MPNGNENQQIYDYSYDESINQIWQADDERKSLTGLNNLFTKVMSDSTFKYNPYDYMYTPMEKQLDIYGARRKMELDFQQQFGVSDSDLAIARWRSQNTEQLFKQGGQMTGDQMASAIETYQLDNMAFTNLSNNHHYFENKSNDDLYTQLTNGYMYDLNQLNEDDFNNWYDKLSPLYKYQLEKVGFDSKEKIKKNLLAFEFEQAIKNGDSEKVEEILGEEQSKAIEEGLKTAGAGLLTTAGLYLAGVLTAIPEPITTGVGLTMLFALGAGLQYGEEQELPVFEDINNMNKNFRNALFNTTIGTLEGASEMAGTLVSYAATGTYNWITGSDVDIKDSWVYKPFDFAAAGFGGINQFVQSETSGKEYNLFTKFIVEGLPQTAGSILGYMTLGGIFSKTPGFGIGAKEAAEGAKLTTGQTLFNIFLSGSKAELAVRTNMSLSEGNDVYKNAKAAGQTDSKALTAALGSITANWGLLGFTGALPGKITRANIKDNQSYFSSKMIKSLAMDSGLEMIEEVAQLAISDVANLYTGAQSEMSDFKVYAESAFYGMVGGMFGAGVDSFKIPNAINMTYKQILSEQPYANSVQIEEMKNKYKAEGKSELRARDYAINEIMQNGIDPDVAKKVYRNLLFTMGQDYVEGYKGFEDYKAEVKAEAIENLGDDYTKEELEKETAKIMSEQWSRDTKYYKGTKTEKSWIKNSSLDNSQKTNDLNDRKRIDYEEDNRNVQNNLVNDIDVYRDDDTKPLSLEDFEDIRDVKSTLGKADIEPEGNRPKVTKWNLIETMMNTQDTSKRSNRKEIDWVTWGEWQSKTNPWVSSSQLERMNNKMEEAEGDIKNALEGTKKTFKKFNKDNKLKGKHYDYMYSKGIINFDTYVEAVRMGDLESTNTEVNKTAERLDAIENVYNEFVKNENMDKAKKNVDKLRAYWEKEFDNASDVDRWVKKYSKHINDKALRFLENFDTKYEKHLQEKEAQVDKKREDKIKKDEKKLENLNKQLEQKTDELNKRDEELKKAKEERKKVRKEAEELSAKKKQVETTDKSRSELTPKESIDQINDPVKKKLSKDTKELERDKVSTTVTQHITNEDNKNDLGLVYGEEIVNKNYSLEGDIQNNEQYLKDLNATIDANGNVNEFMVVYVPDSEDYAIIPNKDNKTEDVLFDEGVDKLGYIDLDAVDSFIVDRNFINEEIIKSNKREYQKNIEDNLSNKQQLIQDEKGLAEVAETTDEMINDLEEARMNLENQKPNSIKQQKVMENIESEEEIRRLEKENKDIKDDLNNRFNFNKKLSEQVLKGRLEELAKEKESALYQEEQISRKKKKKKKLDEDLVFEEPEVTTDRKSTEIQKEIDEIIDTLQKSEKVTLRGVKQYKYIADILKSEQLSNIANEAEIKLNDNRKQINFHNKRIKKNNTQIKRIDTKAELKDKKNKNPKIAKKKEVLMGTEFVVDAKDKIATRIDKLKEHIKKMQGIYEGKTEDIGEYLDLVSSKISEVRKKNNLGKNIGYRTDRSSKKFVVIDGKRVGDVTSIRIDFANQEIANEHLKEFEQFGKLKLSHFKADKKKLEKTGAPTYILDQTNITPVDIASDEFKAEFEDAKRDLAILELQQEQMNDAQTIDEVENIVKTSKVTKDITQDAQITKNTIEALEDGDVDSTLDDAYESDLGITPNTLDETKSALKYDEEFEAIVEDGAKEQVNNIRQEMDSLTNEIYELENELYEMQDEYGEGFGTKEERKELKLKIDEQKAIIDENNQKLLELQQEAETLMKEGKDNERKKLMDKARENRKIEKINEEKAQETIQKLEEENEQIDQETQEVVKKVQEEYDNGASEEKLKELNEKIEKLEQEKVKNLKEINDINDKIDKQNSVAIQNEAQQMIDDKMMENRLNFISHFRGVEGKQVEEEIDRKAEARRIREKKRKAKEKGKEVKEGLLEQDYVLEDSDTGNLTREQARKMNRQSKRQVLANQNSRPKEVKNLLDGFLDIAKKLKDTFTKYGVNNANNALITNAADNLQAKLNKNLELIHKTLKSIFKDMTTEEYTTFTNYLKLKSDFEDMVDYGIDNVTLGSFVEVPPGVTKEQALIGMLQEMSREIEGNENLKRRLALYNEFNSQVNDRLIKRNKEVRGMDLSGRLSRVNYIKKVVKQGQQEYRKNPDKFKKSSALKPLVQYFERMGSKQEMSSNMVELFAIDNMTKMNEIAILDFMQDLKKKDMSKEVLSDLDDKLRGLKDTIVDEILTGKDPDALFDLNKLAEQMLHSTETPETDKEILRDYLANPEDWNYEGQNIIEVMNRMNQDVYNKDLNVLKQFAKDGQFDAISRHQDAIQFLKGERQGISDADMEDFVNYIYQNPNIVRGTNEANHILNTLGVDRSIKKIVSDVGFKHIGDIQSLIPKGMVVTDNMGNRLTKRKQDEELNELGSMFMTDHADPEMMTRTFVNQMMFNSEQDGFIKQGLERGEFLIVDETTARVMDEMKNPVTNSKNWYGKMMSIFKRGALFSPENIMRFTKNAIAMDLWRMGMANPNVIRKVPLAYRYVMEKMRDKPSSKISAKQRAELDKYWDIFTDLYGGGQFKFELKQMGRELMPDVYEAIDKVVGDSAKKLDPISKSAYAVFGKDGIINKTFDATTNFSQHREALLRFAYMLDGIERLDKGLEIEYGSANQKQVENLLQEAEGFETPRKKREVQLRAMALMANQNFINYNETSKFSRWLSKNFFPFMSFQEGNLKLHKRMLQNIFNDITSSKSSFKRRRAGVLKAGIAGGFMTGIAQTLWNQVMRDMFGAPDDELIPEYLKNTSYTLPFEVGGVQDIEGYTLLPFPGLGSIILNKSNGTLELLDYWDKEEPIQNLIDKGLSMSTPLAKLPMEVFQGVDYYSSVPTPKDKQWSKGEHAVNKAFSMLGLGRTSKNTINVLKKLPTKYHDAPQTTEEQTTAWIKGLGSSLIDNSFKSIKDSEEATYTAMKSRQYDYLYGTGEGELDLPEKGKQLEAETTTEALLKDAIRKGLKFGDREYMEKNFAELYNLLKSKGEKTDAEIRNEMKQAIKRQMSVIGAIPNKYKDDYLNNYLNETEREMMKEAIEYEKQMFGDLFDLIYD